jgi:hypothetical protein
MRAAFLALALSAFPPGRDPVWRSLEAARDDLEFRRGLAVRLLEKWDQMLEIPDVFNLRAKIQKDRDRIAFDCDQLTAKLDEVMLAQWLYLSTLPADRKPAH